VKAALLEEIGKAPKYEEFEEPEAGEGEAFAASAGRFAEAGGQAVGCGDALCQSAASGFAVNLRDGWSRRT